MPIDPAMVQWDDAPGAPQATAIDPAAVQWDDESDGLEIDIVGGRTATAADLAADAAITQKPKARPSLFRMDSDFRKRAGVGFGDMAWASARDMFAGEGSAAEYLAREVGGKVEQDGDGSPVVALPDGTRYRVNDAGIDSTDIANVTGNAAAFFLPASWAARFGQARNFGLGARALTQGTTAAATDSVAQATVNEGRIDGRRVAAAGVGGAGGEAFGTVASAATSRLGALQRSLMGANRSEASRVVSDAGMAPTGERVKQYTSRIEELRAGLDPRALIGQQEYGLVYTQGQRMKEGAPRKFDQLSREEVLRQSAGGNGVFADATRTNEQAVGSTLANIGENLGGRAGATPSELAQGAAGRLKEQADELGGRITSAYKKAGESGRTALSPDAIRTLPQRLRYAVREFPIDFNPGGGGHHAPSSLTMPATVGALQQMERATAAILKGPTGSNVKGVTLKALETQRRILSNSINAAASPADRAAVTLMKREFDGWLDESIDGALVSGDPAALAAIKEARGLRFEFGRRFEGRADTDRFITGLLEGTRTPEELVNIALGASQVSKAGGARFVERLKVAAGNDPEVVGQLRAAHFLRMTQGNNGQTLGFGQLVRNIRQTEYSNGSMVKALYSPQEWSEIRRLADALEPLLPKGDFAKSSGSAERIARMMFQKVGSGMPLVGDLIKNFGEGVNAVRASGAVNKPLKLPAQAWRGAQAAGAALGTEFVR